jgi:ADP-ribose pyrophosphatase YjhB (NUDIX family)
LHEELREAAEERRLEALDVKILRLQSIFGFQRRKQCRRHLNVGGFISLIGLSVHLEISFGAKLARDEINYDAGAMGGVVAVTARAAIAFIGLCVS